MLSAYYVLAVIDRVELVQVQQVGQLPHIYAVALVAGFQQRVLARIAHQHFVDMRPQQIIQPRSPRTN